MRRNLFRPVISLLTVIVITGGLSGCEKKQSPVISTDSSFVSSSSFTPLIAQNNDYANPIYPTFNGEKKVTYTADPFVIRGDDGLFYLYCTQTEVFETADSMARKFKRGPVFVSENCVDWVYKSDVFENYIPNWGTDNAGVWAPTVIKIGEFYNFYYSLSTGGDNNPGIGVARSKTPYGPFEHYGKLFNSHEIGVTNSIDPYVFEDDGHIYMVWGSFGGLISAIELTADGLGLLNGLEYQREHKVALGGYEVNEANNYEAAIILKRKGRYYLFLSTGTCCSGAQSSYHVVVATSKNALGPYIDSKGRDMFGPKRGDYVVTPSMSGVMGPGHNGLIEDDQGEIFMIYHGYDTTSSTKDWRVLYLDRMIFDPVTGLPSIENRRASNHETKAGPYIKALEAL